MHYGVDLKISVTRNIIPNFIPAHFGARWPQANIIPRFKNASSNDSPATELAMQHTIRSQICTSFLLLPLYPHSLSLPKNTSLPLIDYLQALTNYSGSRRTRERKKKRQKNKRENNARNNNK